MDLKLSSDFFLKCLGVKRLSEISLQLDSNVKIEGVLLKGRIKVT